MDESSVPSNRMEPELAFSSATSRRPMVVLPQPDSPTRPNVSPRPMAKLTPETALTEPTWRRNTPPAMTGNSLTRSVTSRIGPCAAPSRGEAAATVALAGAWTRSTGISASGSTGWKQANRWGMAAWDPSSVSGGSSARHSSVAN